MARSNKYTPFNFNEIFEKKLDNNSNPALDTSFSAPNRTRNSLPNSKIHGPMLVLTRPSPKTVSTPRSPEEKGKGSQVSASPPADRPGTSPERNDISLRPQGRTGAGTLLSSFPLPSPVKSDRFVPPHLRPGFVGKEEDLGLEFSKGGPASFKNRSEHSGHTPGPVHGVGVHGQRTRPNSGGGYGPMRRDDDDRHI